MEEKATNPFLSLCKAAQKGDKSIPQKKKK
jgi:hypothetical protein